MKLGDKRVFLTGAAGGLGRELASAFARRGAALVLTDTQEGPLADAAAALQTHAPSVEHFLLDVADEAAVRELPSRAGEIDVLVNNAGVVFGGGFSSVPMDHHRLTVDVNLTGLMAVTHALLPFLIGRPQAAILNVASAAAFSGLPGAASYAASKWAVVGFAESLRGEMREQGHHHIKFTTACPSYLDTSMFAGARPLRSTRVVSAKKAAEAMVSAVEKGKLWVRIPWLIKTGPFFRGVLPTPAYDAVGRLLGITTSMDDWRGRED